LDVFNDFFINVAKNIGNPNTVIDENHPSRQATNTDTLTFKPLTSTFVDKQINKLNIKKATGFCSKIVRSKILKLLEEHLLSDSLFCLADNFCS
jgi:hypothetical protein